MDELNIVTGWTRTLLSKILRKIINKKTGTDIDLRVNTLKVNIVDGRVCFHLDLEGEMTKTQFSDMVNKFI